MQCSVGWVGTGVMGCAMCGHLLAAGCSVRVHTRTREKAADLLAKGAVWAATPREAASGSDVTFTMVGFPSDVELVTLGPDGVLARMNGI